MRINSSEIGMESARRYTSVTRKTVTFSSHIGHGKLEKNGNSLQDLLNGGLNKDEKADKNEKLENMETDLKDRFSQVRAVSNSRVDALEDSLKKIRESCLIYLLNLLFGRPIEPEADCSQDAAESGAGEKEAYLVDYTSNIEYYHKETEQTSFSTVGKVVTADGKEIEFNLGFEMSRSFEEQYSETRNWQEIQFTDPLVINLDSNVASVSDQKFWFDLDGDGTQEEINELGEGSGYLAFDRNKDGIINDGTELFGTQNGDGFADLAQYDLDKNGWIDEDDAIFDKLQIWTKDANGNDVLYKLKDKGIGAICLQNVKTDYELKDDKTNMTNAAIRKTGIFLYENGSAGTVQHLDMAR